jgi:hypothetical protein
MARARRNTGRTTPKGGEQPAGRRGARIPGRRHAKPGRTTERTSGRYTPPVPRAKKVSPRWVPIVMLTCLVVGVVVVVINYLGVLPGGASNWYLLAGLGLIALGFVTATQYR